MSVFYNDRNLICYNNFMKSLTNYSHINDDRKGFCEWYNTPTGRMLRESEAEFLTRAMNVTYKQLILQVGALGWENLFLDEEMFCNFNVVDRQLCGHLGTNKISANVQDLPIQEKAGCAFTQQPGSME